MKRAVVVAFLVGFAVSMIGLSSKYHTTEIIDFSIEGSEKEGLQAGQKKGNTGGSQFDCGEAILVGSDFVCPEQEGSAYVSNIPESCDTSQMKVSWYSEEGVRLNVEEGKKLDLKGNRGVTVRAEKGVTKQDVKIDATITGSGDSCRDCGTASHTMDVGCYLRLSGAPASTTVGEEVEITVHFGGCGSESDTDTCTMDVNVENALVAGESFAANGDSQLSFSGGGGSGTISITPLEAGEMKVTVDGHDCNCGNESRTITVLEKGEGSCKEVDVTVNKLTDNNTLCLDNEGEWEASLTCNGDTGKTYETDIIAKGGDKPGKLDTVRLGCGERETGELIIKQDFFEENDFGATRWVRAVTEKCGDDPSRLTDTSDDFFLDRCRVQLSGSGNSNTPVCPGDELQFSGNLVCKKENCSDGFDWTFPAGLSRIGGGDGTATLQLKNNTSRPVGGQVVAEPQQSGDSGCQDCRQGSISAGVVPVRKGSYKVSKDINGPVEPRFGADGYGRQWGQFTFNLENLSDSGFLENGRDARITSIEITNAYVYSIGFGHRFPWIERTFEKSANRPTIRSVSIAGERFEVDENLNDGQPRTYENLSTNIVIMNDKRLDELLNVRILSPREKVEVFAGIGFRVNYEDRCGRTQTFSFSNQFRGLGSFEGLEVKRIPDVVFADADYWMPVKVQLPDIESDGYDESEVEEVRVSLRDEGDFEVKTTGEVRTFSPGPSDGLSWGFGDGTTGESNSFEQIDDESEVKLDGRRVMTVFVNLNELFSGVDFLKETDNSRPVHLIKKGERFTMPHFNVHVSLNSDFSVENPLQFASVTPEEGRPDVLADPKIGPVVEGEEPPQDIGWITQEAKSHGYLAPIVFQEAKLKHEDEYRDFSVSFSTRDGSDRLFHTAILREHLSRQSDMRLEYDEGLARVQDHTNKDYDIEGDLQLTTNLAEVSSGAHSGEKGASIATVTNGSMFYISYGKNENINGINAMDLSDAKVDVEINEPPFEGGKLALGRKSFDESLAADVTVSLTVFVSGAAITYLTAGVGFWAYVGTGLSAGSTTYGILNALDNDTNAANVTRVDLDARLFDPDEYARTINNETTLKEISGPVELAWNIDADPPASEELDAGEVVWEQRNETYSFYNVKFPGTTGNFFRNGDFDQNDLKVGQRIDFRFHARIESTMRNEWLDNIQVISKIWYEHPDQPPLREVEVEPVNEAE